jgi:branched-chain amino acid transport system permease protein
MILDVLSASAMLVLVVLGLALILGLMDVINLAHTGLMAVGVYAAVTVSKAGYGFWLAALAGAAAAGVLGAIVERLVVRRLYGRPLDTILATWGISLIIAQGIAWIYGRGPQTLGNTLLSDVWLGYSAYRLFIVIVAAALVAALWAVMRFTPWGLTARVVMANEPLARGLGINTVRVRRVTFVLGASLAGLGGALLGPIQGISPSFAMGIMVPGFLSVLLSGQSLSGLVIACVALATTQTLFAYFFNPVYATVAIIVTAVVLLRLFPRGLVWHRA